MAILNQVVMIFTAPKIDYIPAKWRLKLVRSTKEWNGFQ